MTHTPKTVSPDAKLQEVASIMCLYRIPALPVVDEDGKLVGNISEMDLLRNLFPTMEDIMAGEAVLEIDSMTSNYSASMKLRVSDLMVKNPVSVSPNQHVLKATAKMTSNRFRRIPVTDDDGKLVGVMSLGDVHKAIFQFHVSVG
ncbi:MAG: CBS domain-containing protein [Gammaproteobacteria bacterium]|nr:CBS domain-containing protein [Gammaproteobacteria bacterium]MDX2487614.1 CBS domain-containing protein [Gammaproteobacteria bacterium]